MEVIDELISDYVREVCIKEYLTETTLQAKIIRSHRQMEHLSATPEPKGELNYESVDHEFKSVQQDYESDSIASDQFLSVRSHNVQLQYANHSLSKYLSLRHGSESSNQHSVRRLPPSGKSNLRSVKSGKRSQKESFGRFMGS